MSSSGSGGTPRSCNTALHWKTAALPKCGQFSQDKTVLNHLERCSLLWNSFSLDKNSIYNLLKDKGWEEQLFNSASKAFHYPNLLNNHFVAALLTAFYNKWKCRSSSYYKNLLINHRGVCGTSFAETQRRRRSDPRPGIAVSPRWRTRLLGGNELMPTRE